MPTNKETKPSVSPDAPDATPKANPAPETQPAPPGDVYFSPNGGSVAATDEDGNPTQFNGVSVRAESHEEAAKAVEAAEETQGVDNEKGTE